MFHQINQFYILFLSQTTLRLFQVYSFNFFLKKRKKVKSKIKLFFKKKKIATPLEELTDEQLRAIEGNERRQIEERIRMLQNIQNQITGIIVQLTQYQQVFIQDPLQQNNPQNQNQNQTQTQTQTQTQQESSSSNSNSNIPTENQNDNIASSSSSSNQQQHQEEIESSEVHQNQS